MVGVESPGLAQLAFCNEVRALGNRQFVEEAQSEGARLEVFCKVRGDPFVQGLDGGATGVASKAVLLIRVLCRSNRWRRCDEQERVFCEAVLEDVIGL